MTCKEAERKLKAARKKAKAAQEEVARLKELVTALGGHPNPDHSHILPRNKGIYKRWADGSTYTELARAYKLSVTRISGICRRIDRILERDDPERFPDYADLLPYKK